VRHPLKVLIQYGDLKAEFEGDFNEVWKTMNSFLNKVRTILMQSDRTHINVKRKGSKKSSITDILIELRNTGFFDKPRSSKDCITKIKELGKTNITPNAVQMALKYLVEKGELNRKMVKNKSYVYFAPYIDDELMEGQ